MAPRKKQPAKPTPPAAPKLTRAQRFAVYAAISQGDWIQLSGRQAKILQDQARRYGLPIGGATISLEELAPALHDFLARHARLLSSESDRSSDVPKKKPTAAELYHREKARVARIERLRLVGKLIDRDALHEGLGRVAGILRSAGETLRNRFGAEAHRVMEDALSDCEREIRSLAANGSNDRRHR